MSRPLVVHRMNVGDPTFRYMGKHRRTTLREVLALKARIDARGPRWRRLPTMPRISSSATAFEPAIAVFDACILYPFHLRNIVVQAAVDRLIHARWTDEIHEEWI